MKKAPAFTFYFLNYAALAFLMPFMILYYQSLGFNGAQIGLLAGVSPLISLVSGPFWTGLADTTRRHRLIMSLTIAAAVTAAIVLSALKTLGPVFLFIALYACAVAPVSSFADNATLAMLGDEKATYGQLRLGGTIGWGLAAPLAGTLVQTYGLKLAFWSYAALMLLGLIVSQFFVYGKAPSVGASMRGGLRALLANRRWLLFLALAFVGGMGLTSLNSFLFAYLQELGATQTVMGFALTISTIPEVLVLFFGHRLLKRFGAHNLLVLAMALMGTRLLLLTIFNFPAGVLVFQLVGGLAFPALWVAGVSYADQNAPPGLGATAQGLFGAMVFGFGSAAGGFLGGLLLEGAGGRVMYLVFGLLVLLATAVATAVERRLPAESPAALG